MVLNMGQFGLSRIIREPIAPTTDACYDCATLLCHFDSFNDSQIFTDSSTFQHQMYFAGNPKILTEQSKFGGSSLYIDDATYTGRVLVPNDQRFRIKDGEDFCIEAWVNPTVNSSIVDRGICAQWEPSGGNSDNNSFLFYLEPSNYFSFLMWAPGYVSYLVQSDVKVYANKWTHLAATRVDGIIRIFVDGVVQSQTLSYSGPSQLSANPISIGSLWPTANEYPWKGYIDELRITHGCGRYSESFTVPSAPFIDDGSDPYFSNVALLLKGDGPAGSTTIYDSSTMHWNVINEDLTPAEIVTTSKFGKGAIELGGSSGRTYIFYNWYLEPRNLDFTVEFWVKRTAAGGLSTWVSTRSSVANYASIIIQRDGTTLYTYSSNNGSSWAGTISGGTLNDDGNFHHIAYTRESANLRLFLDGTLIGSDTITGQLYNAGQGFWLGQDANDNFSDDIIDDFR